MMAAFDPSSWTVPRLRIDREGTWYHEDQEVTHEGIVAGLQEGLRVDAGGHYLQVGPARVPVAVEDAPFVVVRVEPEAGGVVATLGDLSREPLDVETLRLGEGAVPYCRVKGGRFAARLSRAATYQLLRMMEPDEA
ncbi:MAG: DUF1285 domain-containing protein, partial [candidate division NC10 bacterium]